MVPKYLAEPKTSPALHIPKSDKTVQVSVIDSTSRIDIPIEPYLEPLIKGNEKLTGPAFSFLIEHSSGKRILFDLGIRKDWENLPPIIANTIKTKKGWNVTVEKNVAEILEESGVDVKGGAIDAVVWSHHHWDHIGDMTTFPNSTELVIGPGFRKQYLPGYPETKDSALHAHDFQGRPVREIDFTHDSAGLQLGRFNAHDYFGDGSFYLLDTPGHSVGHMCGLARTTASTFVFMGGDASHHGGEFRPSEYLPLPAEISPSPFRARRLAPVCPGHLLLDVHRNKNASEPFYSVKASFAHDLTLCNWTIAGLQEFDADESVLLLVAHDESVMPVLDFYPKAMNDWHEKDLAKKAKWRFLGDYEEAIKIDE